MRTCSSFHVPNAMRVGNNLTESGGNDDNGWLDAVITKQEEISSEWKNEGKPSAAKNMPETSGP